MNLLTEKRLTRAVPQPPPRSRGEPLAPPLSRGAPEGLRAQRPLRVPRALAEKRESPSGHDNGPARPGTLRHIPAPHGPLLTFLLRESRSRVTVPNCPKYSRSCGSQRPRGRCPTNTTPGVSSSCGHRDRVSPGRDSPSPGPRPAGPPRSPWLSAWCGPAAPSAGTGAAAGAPAPGAAPPSRPRQTRAPPPP